jgi:hypothetical protein
MLFMAIVLVGLIRHQKWKQVEGNLIIFGVLGGLGIILWLLWCTIIFGDPLYFQHSAFSSQAQQTIFLQSNTLYTYHDILQSFRYYVLDAIDVVGPWLCVLAAFSVVSFVSQRRLMIETVAFFIFLAPFAFYIFSLYNGQAIIYVPEAVPAHATQHLFNVRYGAEMVVPAAVFIATLISRLRLPKPVRWLGSLLRMIMIAVIVIQMALLVSGGIITLQDGEHGVSCEAEHQIIVYLAQHYNGGKILEDIFASSIDGADAGIEMKNFINESSGIAWTTALKDPAPYTNWIILRPTTLRRPDDPYDLVSQSIDLQSPAFLRQFTLVVQEPTGLELFQRNGLSPLPTRPVPPGLIALHSRCGAAGS